MKQYGNNSQFKVKHLKRFSSENWEKPCNPIKHVNILINFKFVAKINLFPPDEYSTILLWQVPDDL